MKPTYYQQQKINISNQVMLVLKTVLLLRKPFGSAYIARILMGDDAFGFRDVEHTELETFAELSEVSYSFMDDVINYLVRENYLEITHDIYGTVDITDKGRDWLGDANPIIVTQGEIKKSWYQVQLGRILKEIRKKTAENTLQLPHNVFTNFTLKLITDKMPQTADELNEIPGVSEFSESLKLIVLSEVSRMWEKKEEDDKSGLFRKAYSPSHRKVKDLFEEGKDLETIALERKLKHDTVVTYLKNLHKAEVINLRPWIEATVDSKDFYKGTEYFKQVSQPKLKDAHSILGLDYPILELCKLYVQEDSEIRLKFAS